MKKVYYLCHCGSGTTVHMNLIDLVSDDGKVLKFHYDTFDWDYNKSRVITLKATRVTRAAFDGTPYKTIYFRSSKEQFKYSFIRELEIEDDKEPERCIIKH